MNKYWFKPKRRGWGISYPISWEGWLSLILLIACFYIEKCFTDIGSTKGIFVFILEIIISSLVFIFILKNKIEGGLKWRSGKKEE